MFYNVWSGPNIRMNS